MSQQIDPAVCPICGGPNMCGELDKSNQTDGRCWCALETFPREIFQLVPKEKKDKACICKTCLDQFKTGELPVSPVENF